MMSCTCRCTQSEVSIRSRSERHRQATMSCHMKGQSTACKHSVLQGMANTAPCHLPQRWGKEQEAKVSAKAR